MNGLQKYAAKQAIIIKLAESEAIENLKGDNRSFTGSRVLTSPLAMGLYTGAGGGAAGAMAGGAKGALLGAGLGGAYGAGVMGLNRVLQARAQRGRAAAGQKGSGSEAQVLEALRQSGDKSGTNPIARALTSTAGGAGLGGAYGALSGAQVGGGKAALVGGLLGALGGGGIANLGRILGARAAKGRANEGTDGIGTSGRAVIDALRAAKA